MTKLKSYALEPRVGEVMTVVIQHDGMDMEILDEMVYVGAHQFAPHTMPMLFFAREKKVRAINTNSVKELRYKAYPSGESKTQEGL